MGSNNGFTIFYNTFAICSQGVGLQQFYNRFAKARIHNPFVKLVLQ